MDNRQSVSIREELDQTVGYSHLTEPDRADLTLRGPIRYLPYSVPFLLLWYFLAKDA